MSSTASSASSPTWKPAVAPLLCSAGRAPSGRVVTMEEEVVWSGQRSISAVSIPKSPRRRSTQSPIRSSPTPPTARTRIPCFAATTAAEPAAPETASVNSSTKVVPPPGGISVTGRASASKVMNPIEV